jgi:uncharacterized protein YsxB (DUF464 family)
MIKAKLFKNSDNQIYRLELTGHADSGPYGQDIVCAAVSALAITTVNGLSDVIEAHPQIDSDDNNGGHLIVSDYQVDHDSEVLLQTFANGITDIQKNYADFIQVQEIHEN